MFEAKRCDLAFDHALNGVLIAHQNRGNFRYEIKSNENIETETRINAAIDVHRTKIIFDSKRQPFSNWGHQAVFFNKMIKYNNLVIQIFRIINLCMMIFEL